MKHLPLFLCLLLVVVFVGCLFYPRNNLPDRIAGISMEQGIQPVACLGWTVFLTCYYTRKPPVRADS